MDIPGFPVFLRIATFACEATLQLCNASKQAADHDNGSGRPGRRPAHECPLCSALPQRRVLGPASTLPYAGWVCVCVCQYHLPAVQVPWRALILATGLFITGMLLILLSVLIFLGLFDTKVRSPFTQ